MKKLIFIGLLVSVISNNNISSQLLPKTNYENVSRPLADLTIACLAQAAAFNIGSGFYGKDPALNIASCSAVAAAILYAGNRKLAHPSSSDLSKIGSIGISALNVMQGAAVFTSILSFFNFSFSDGFALLSASQGLALVSRVIQDKSNFRSLEGDKLKRITHESNKRNQKIIALSSGVLAALAATSLARGY